ncbi:hypothetical protein PILCRDRAFT_612091 [Piloderma croceum F 1598]|uniref:Uncharacterized protein n=1 Tax=Piloderma croceum (strain F 1598) TaxID=765440 RepID=A0A0C3FDL9_PILCF|nr:hypothetical protein PILCRDRAFT_612091 [Piloderma croceum F 1598]
MLGECSRCRIWYMEHQLAEYPRQQLLQYHTFRPLGCENSLHIEEISISDSLMSGSGPGRVGRGLNLCHRVIVMTRLRHIMHFSVDTQHTCLAPCRLPFDLIALAGAYIIARSVWKKVVDEAKDAPKYFARQHWPQWTRRDVAIENGC